jgi:hypothetical protein
VFESTEKLFSFIERHKIAVILAMMFMQFVSLALDTHSLFDRAAIKRNAQMNQKMLDARARIQITLIETGKRRGSFTEDEMKTLKDNWTAAEYEAVKENPFK